MLQSLGTQLGMRIARKGEIQCASWRWNILENIIYVKQVVDQFLYSIVRASRSMCQ